MHSNQNSKPDNSDSIIHGVSKTIFIIGGNDLDDHDHTDEHLRDISFAFMKTARQINTRGIRTFFLPIHPRRTPRYAKVDRYHMEADKMSLAIGEYCERQFGYSAIIRDNTTNRKFWRDGIHLDEVDYEDISKNITKHIRDNIYKTARPAKPLQKNKDFLEQENMHKRQGKRDINNTTQTEVRAYSGEDNGTQTEVNDLSGEGAGTNMVEKGTQTHLTVDRLALQLSGGDMIQ